MTGACYPKWWGWAPLVVAEALHPLADPLPGLLRAGPLARPGEVARALAASLGATRAVDPPPSWLDAAQSDAFRLLLPVLRKYGAALCAEPVGTGKTYLALAVANAIGPASSVAVVPAALVEQWRGTAQRLGISMTVWSHARLSLGRLPPDHPALVIVDESHHFRNPMIRRYRTLAPWLAGRKVLLLSATPIVNHPRDLFHQLHLGIRDDALAADGAPSMRAAFDQDNIPAALGRFVVQRLNGHTRPSSASRRVSAPSGAVALIPDLDSLRLSSDRGIAALVRSVFLRAASSSAAALEGSLRRYRALLLHARDARDSGRALDRASLRRFTFGADDQLLLWALFPTEARESELRVDDLPLLEGILARAGVRARRADAKSELLRTILSDGHRSVVFTGARETILYLRNQLTSPSVAWCTGERSGIGRAAFPRGTVLSWFRPGEPDHRVPVTGRPAVLLATDVVAEGLDLQAAGRIVHYDLPWTEVRLQQRDGRVIRRGSCHGSIEVIQLAPGPRFEERLHQLERLAVKGGLPRLQGLGPEGRGRWRWRGELSDTLPGRAVEGVASIASGAEGVLAGIALEGQSGPVVSTVLWREVVGDWTADPGIVAARIAESAGASPGAPPSASEISGAIASLSPQVRVLLRQAAAYRIAGSSRTRAASHLGRRLRQLAAAAARRRDAGQLAVLESALGFCAGGHTAGEAMLIEGVVKLDDQALLARLPSLPRPTAQEGALRPRLSGLIVFRGPDSCPDCS